MEHNTTGKGTVHDKLVLIAYMYIGLAPITKLRTCVMKIVHNEGRSSNRVSDFPNHNELLLKERIRSL